MRRILPVIAVATGLVAAGPAQAQQAVTLIDTLQDRVAMLTQSPGLLGAALTVFLVIVGVSIVLKRRATSSTLTDTLAVHSLVAMSQVAIADGRIKDNEVHQIAMILTRLTGKPYMPETVMDMLERLNPSTTDLEDVGRDLSEKDRQIVLEAALNIAVADGEIQPAEYAVVSELAQRMRIGADQFRAAMSRIAAHLQTMQPV